ncbi:CPBP family glutamic-type intramembrane protease [Stieleria sp. TO1_6]|uniref:CPBP family glutamic-type intramembrane protease n=1 Tax=Stieleria tagensis TaxID=2956795 RepID=UPI00209B8ED8|nr:CPBP family glutamic-type intramembrane protease [Stieleria tagensis]MCO8124600.1 CPBP family glutamic-type intramembrane protease [Stieleria tagensis]
MNGGRDDEPLSGSERLTGSEPLTGGRGDADWQSKAAMIVPLVIFFLLGAVIDTRPLEDGVEINPLAYMGLVGARVLLMTLAIVWFWPRIRSQFPVSVDQSGIWVGVIGAVIWIGACGLQLERGLLTMLGISTDWLPAREGVNPFAVYSPGTELACFLVMRFALLVISVPIAEELFLRGFVMRAVESEDWPSLPLSRITATGLVAGTLYGMVSHPGELVAAGLWFSLVSWLMVRTGKFWNCVLAHAVTNFILGVYVCWYGQWYLW